MPENELPKNMGKKIADALKKQNEGLETDTVTEAVAEEYNTVDNNDFNTAENNDFGNSMSFESDFNNSDYSAPVFNVDTEDVDENPELKLTIDSEDDSEEFEMPNNINVLKRLISQLPSGVPRQTGAQIIRQTIEALGIPMKSVLQDAQRVRDCLNSSIKDCHYTIQEYKSNIKNLEKQSASYQRQLSKLNDIIGLFVYNEKK